MFEHPCPACGHPNRHRRLTAPRTLELCERCGVRLSTGRLDSRGVFLHYLPWIGSIVLTALLGAALVGAPMLIGAEFLMDAGRFATLRPVLAPVTLLLGGGGGAAVGIWNWRRHRRGVARG